MSPLTVSLRLARRIRVDIAVVTMVVPRASLRGFRCIRQQQQSQGARDQSMHFHLAPCLSRQAPLDRGPVRGVRNCWSQASTRPVHLAFTNDDAAYWSQNQR